MQNQGKTILFLVWLLIYNTIKKHTKKIRHDVGADIIRPPFPCLLMHRIITFYPLSDNNLTHIKILMLRADNIRLYI